jgi:FkbM family methyltransferase
MYNERRARRLLLIAVLGFGFLATVFSSIPCSIPPDALSNFSMHPTEPRPFVTWAQDLEEFFLYHPLRYIRNGFYIDVGANSPHEISVTKAFYLMNWSGVNIEPLHHRYVELVRDRPRDVNLNFGIGNKRSSFAFWDRDGDSTMDPQEGRKFGQSVRIVSVYPLMEVVTNYSIATCHFCKIDVEGFERQVLEGIDFTKFRPWSFCIESTLPGTAIPCHDRWEDVLLAAGYKLGCAHWINRYYYDAVHHPELAKDMICEAASSRYKIIRGNSSTIS